MASQAIPSPGDLKDVVPVGTDEDIINQGAEEFDKEHLKDDDEPIREEGDEEVEDEEGEKEEDKEDEEEEEPEVEARTDRPSYKEIKKEYPDIFKKFPELREVYFREKAYNELFPTVDDAKEASDNAQNYVVLRDSVIVGDLKPLLDALTGTGSMSRFASRIIPELYKASKEDYFQAVTPLFENLVRGAFNEGRAAGNKNLMYAAEHLSQYVFGSTEYARGTKSHDSGRDTKDPERERLEQERQQFELEKYNTARDEVIDVAENELNRMINKGLDPDGIFSDELKAMLLDNIVRKVGDQLKSDAQHMATMNSLWKRGAKSGFSRELRQKLISTYLARAKSVMPAIREKVRSAAVKTRQKDSEDKVERSEKVGERREGSGAPASGDGKRRGPVNAKDVDWGKTSDEDFLAGNVTYKKRV